MGAPLDFVQWYCDSVYRLWAWFRNAIKGDA